MIVCFGDSITQGGHSPEHVGWVGRLEDFYCRKADVLNRGFSGYNTDWLSRMLVDLFSRMFRRRPPVLVTIWLGANDATVESSRQHVPLWKYKENLEKMVRFFKGLGRRDRQVRRAESGTEGATRPDSRCLRVSNDYVNNICGADSFSMEANVCVCTTPY